MKPLSKLLINILFVFPGIWTHSLVLADESVTPLEIAGATKVSAEQVFELATNKPELIIIDSRIPGDRLKGHIESSVSLPNTKTNCQTLSNILPQKNTPALFYCNGIKCGRSGKAIHIAKQCGFKNLYWFRGGFEVWLEKGMPYMKE